MVSPFQPNRRTEKVLTLLRISYTCRAPHFFLEGSSPLVFDQCHARLTVEHILIDCIKSTTTRLHYGMISEKRKSFLCLGVERKP